MEINRLNINEIVNKSNVHPDKDYGQNFLIEPKLSSDIVSYLECEKKDKVLKTHPCIVPYSELDDDTKNYDRNIVNTAPLLVQEVAKMDRM